MKLNIEDLALQADPTCSGSLIGPTAVRTFALLIVERCAVECESLWRIDGQLTADEFATELRNLLDDK